MVFLPGHFCQACPFEKQVFSEHSGGLTSVQKNQCFGQPAAREYLECSNLWPSLDSIQASDYS
jgi:hypothetical protein